MDDDEPCCGHTHWGRVACAACVREGGPCAVLPEERHEHQWWHAPGVTRHLVCLTCGLGLHDVRVMDYPHLTVSGSTLVPCHGATLQEVAS